MGFLFCYGLVIIDGFFMSSCDGFMFKCWNEVFIWFGLEWDNNWVYGDVCKGLGMIEMLVEYSLVLCEFFFYAIEGYWKDVSLLCCYIICIDGFVLLHVK